MKEPPFWKRFIICTFLKRRQARIARAASIIAREYYYDKDYEFAQKLFNLQEALWNDMWFGSSR